MDSARAHNLPGGNPNCVQAQQGNRTVWLAIPFLKMLGDPTMGVITASFGGVLRDVFFARVPQTFMPSQLYASAAAAGAIVYVLLWELGVSSTLSFLACFLLTFMIRMASVKFNIQSG